MVDSGKTGERKKHRCRRHEKSTKPAEPTKSTKSVASCCCGVTKSTSCRRPKKSLVEKKENAFKIWGVSDMFKPLFLDEERIEEFRNRVAESVQTTGEVEAKRKRIKKLFANGTIGGRQIKLQVDDQYQIILFSDTDETQLSEKEVKQFQGILHTVLPIIDNRKYKIPIMRSYHLGVRILPPAK